MIANPGLQRVELSLRQRLLLLAGGLLLLAFADFVVLERIYKPLATARAIPWSDFELRFDLAGWPVRMLQWHVAFLPLGLGMFALVGVAARDLRLALAGCVLFATGWEDLVYYAIQATSPPAELPWLDPNPCIAWTSWVLPGEHVTAPGLCLAALAGGIATAWILRGRGGTHAPPCTDAEKILPDRR